MNNKHITEPLPFKRGKTMNFYVYRDVLDELSVPLECAKKNIDFPDSSLSTMLNHQLKVLFYGQSVNSEDRNYLTDLITNNEELNLNNVHEYYELISGNVFEKYRKKPGVYSSCNETVPFADGLKPSLIKNEFAHLLEYAKESCDNAIEKYYRGVILFTYFVYLSPYPEANSKIAKALVLKYFFDNDISEFSIFISVLEKLASKTIRKSLIRTFNCGNIEVFINRINTDVIQELQLENKVIRFEQGYNLNENQRLLISYLLHQPESPTLKNFTGFYNMLENDQKTSLEIKKEIVDSVIELGLVEGIYQHKAVRLQDRIQLQLKRLD